MKQVAKLIMVDKNETYLLLELNKHPSFGNDADVPGGTVDAGESSLIAMIREVREEIGVNVESSDVTELYAGDEYSKNGTHYTLYLYRVEDRPKITLSWEHISYQWLPVTDFIEKSYSARDTYMHMVADVIKAGGASAI